jgi:hypothetical protein
LGLVGARVSGHRRRGLLVLALVGKKRKPKPLLSLFCRRTCEPKQKLTAALAMIGQPKEFCILVSDTIRWYLEERFEFHAPERTTEEFLHELRGTDLLSSDQKQSLVEFLNRCDLVKFARYEPGEPELRDLHHAAVRLVEETEPVSAPDHSTSSSNIDSPAVDTRRSAPV